MPRRKQYTILAGITGALCLLLAPCAVRAQVSMPTITFANGLYTYNYSISDPSADDLFQIDIHVLTGPGVVTNLLTPTVNGDAFAFVSAYDSGLGLVSFLENSSNFTSVPLSGFSFQSSFGPRSGAFDGNYAPASGGIVVLSGNTLAPVPEPGSIALIGSFCVMAGCALRRRKRNA